MGEKHLSAPRHLQLTEPHTTNVLLVSCSEMGYMGCVTQVRKIIAEKTFLLLQMVSKAPLFYHLIFKTYFRFVSPFGNPVFVTYSLALFPFLPVFNLLDYLFASLCSKWNDAEWKGKPKKIVWGFLTELQRECHIINNNNKQERKVWKLYSGMPKIMTCINQEVLFFEHLFFARCPVHSFSRSVSPYHRTQRITYHLSHEHRVTFCSNFFSPTATRLQNMQTIEKCVCLGFMSLLFSCFIVCERSRFSLFHSLVMYSFFSSLIFRLLGIRRTVLRHLGSFRRNVFNGFDPQPMRYFIGSIYSY